jgi:hypothetical protein
MVLFWSEIFNLVNLVGMFVGLSFTNCIFLCVDWNSRMATIAGHCFNKMKNNISQKLEMWLNPNCTWKVIGWFLTKLSIFCGVVIQDGHHVYGVYISQLIWYSRACGSYQDFLDRGLLLTRGLLNQGFLLVKLKSSLRKFYGRQHDLVDRFCVTNDHRYVSLVVNTSWSFPHSWLITGFVTRLTRRVPLVEQLLPTLPEHLSSPPNFSGFVLLDL